MCECGSWVREDSTEWVSEPEPEPGPELEPEPDPNRVVLCYKCGETGHVRDECTNDENPDRVAELKAFRTARKQRQKEQQQAEGKQPKERDCAGVARTWLAEQPPACSSDPVGLVTGCGSKQLQRDLAAAAKLHFDRGIHHIVAQLACSGGDARSPEEYSSAGEALASALRGALRDGIPPDFSDAAGLTSYTQERLQARCRYLYTLLLCEDEVCSAARSELLLPRADQKQRRPLSVLSIGGGPAFDDVALRLLASFLAGMPCGENAAAGLPPVQISTVVLDLFEEEWTAAAKAVATATESATASGLLGGNGDATTLRLARCDVRLGLGDEVNAALAELVPGADLFVFSFVLHENAAGLLLETESAVADSAADESVPPRIGGCLTGLFSAARVGSFIVMMDASHRLWPSIVNEAAPLGWRATIPTRVRGPFTAARAAKHTLVLHREAESSDAPGAALQGIQADLDMFAKHLSAHTSNSGSGAA